MLGGPIVKGQMSRNLLKESSRDGDAASGQNTGPGPSKHLGRYSALHRTSNCMVLGHTAPQSTSVSRFGISRNPNLAASNPGRVKLMTLKLILITS